MIASSNDCQQGAIVGVMLSCTEYPSRKVAQIPLRFWYHLARALSRLDPSDPAKQKVGMIVREPYLQLAKLCVRLAVRHPDHDVDATADNKEADGDEYARHRQDLFDVWSDCALVAGADAVLDAIATELQHAAAPGNACDDSVEACLYALRSIADLVPPDEARVMPGALQLVCQLPADWRRARTQGCMLIGSFFFARAGIIQVGASTRIGGAAAADPRSPSPASS